MAIDEGDGWIEPWPEQFVVVGGWAMQLYRYLEGADSSVAVEHTKDVDIAVLVSPRIQTALPIRLGDAVRTVSASRVPFLCDLGDMEIRIPSPASYLLAKSLVYERRKRDEKRDGDCAYLYWLALVTRGLWPELRRDLAALNVHAKWLQRAHAQLRSLFEHRTSDGVVRAVRSIADTNHSSAVVHGVMRRFLAAIGVLDQSGAHGSAPSAIQ